MASRDRRPGARPSGGLDHRKVASAALALVDEDGAAACSLRAVATRLGVTPMALYWYVADKHELLDAVLDLVLEEVAVSLQDAEAARGADPFSAVTALAHRFRAAFARHPHVAPLLATQAPGGAAGHALQEATLGWLHQAGLDAVDAVCAYLLLVEFLMGAVIMEHAPADGAAPPLPPPDVRFDFGLQCLVEGLRARAGHGR